MLLGPFFSVAQNLFWTTIYAVVTQNLFWTTIERSADNKKVNLCYD